MDNLWETLLSLYNVYLRDQVKVIRIVQPVFLTAEPFSWLQENIKKKKKNPPQFGTKALELDIGSF